ncbi:MAG: hypothetical protein H5T66_10820 [Chloroflexi bacterium]|nr:hypothetical protein [Chloroflexota bacterium]
MPIATSTVARPTVASPPSPTPPPAPTATAPPTLTLPPSFTATPRPTESPLPTPSATLAPTSTTTPSITPTPGGLQIKPDGTFSLIISEAELYEMVAREAAGYVDPEVYRLKVAIQPEGVRISARLFSRARALAIDAVAMGVFFIIEGKPQYEITSSDIEVLCYLCRQFDVNSDAPSARITPGPGSTQWWEQVGQGMIQSALWDVGGRISAQGALLGKNALIERITLGEHRMTVEGRIR